VSRIRIAIAVSIILTLQHLGASPNAAAQQRAQLHFLAPGLSTEVVSLLENELLPAFEAEYNVDVYVDPIAWGERSDRIAILIASGNPPDVIGTGYYSPYQEGGSRLLAPLDRYVAGWNDRSAIPEPVWETQTWRGSIVAVPLYFDLRAIAYNRNVFAESGLPRRSLHLNPVALGFINGLGITELSRNKDFAWKFIEFFMSSEVLAKMQAVSGWMTTRVDLAEAPGAAHLTMYYPQVPYIKPAQLPPPRDRSQNELSQLMTRAINGEIAPEQAMLQAHELWARLLEEWRSQL